MFNNFGFWITLFLVVGAVIILILCRLISIQKENDGYDDCEFSEIGDNFPPDIINIPGRQSLFFSYETRIVYQMYEEDDIEFLEPFISNNNLCKYINCRVVEVVEDKIIAIVHTACLPN